jgi:hypothetical protein
MARLGGRDTTLHLASRLFGIDLTDGTAAVVDRDAAREVLMDDTRGVSAVASEESEGT